MKLVKTTGALLMILTLIVSINPKCFAGKVDEKEKTKVYYFHKNRRCPTCMAIEKQTRKVLKEEPFAQEKKDKELEFKSLNSENSVNKKLVKEFGVSGSALFVVKGDETIDLTQQAFLYARTQPDKFKAILRETLD